MTRSITRLTKTGNSGFKLFASRLRPACSARLKSFARNTPALNGLLPAVFSTRYRAGGHVHRSQRRPAGTAAVPAHLLSRECDLARRVGASLLPQSRGYQETTGGATARLVCRGLSTARS